MLTPAGIENFFQETLQPTLDPTADIPGFAGTRRKEHMPTLVVTHEVDDVDHWLASPKREELFGPLGITARPFRNADGSNLVGLVVDVPDIATGEQAIQTPEAAEAMKHDGVRPETLVTVVES